MGQYFGNINCYRPVAQTFLSFKHKPRRTMPRLCLKRPLTGRTGLLAAGLVLGLVDRARKQFGSILKLKKINGK